MAVERKPNRGRGVSVPDRGFASMNRTRQLELASKGGKTAHQNGTAHEFTSDEARKAGRKGGLSCARKQAERKLTALAAADPTFVKGGSDVVDVAHASAGMNPPSIDGN